MPRSTASRLTGERGRRARTRTFRVELTLRTALIAVITIAVVWLFIHLWPVVLVLIVALMVAGALNPMVEWLQRRKLKRGLAIAIVFLGLLLATAGFVAVTVPKLLAQAMSLAR